MMRFPKIEDGKKMSRGPRTSKDMAQKLSRLYDALHACEAAGIEYMIIWDAAERDLKMRFNYCSWIYSAEQEVVAA